MFDRGKAVTDCIECGSGLCLAIVGTLSPFPHFRDEFQTAFVDVRRQDRDAHALTFADKHRNLFRIVDFIAEQPSHEFDRIMRL